MRNLTKAILTASAVLLCVPLYVEAHHHDWDGFDRHEMRRWERHERHMYNRMMRRENRWYNHHHHWRPYDYRWAHCRHHC